MPTINLARGKNVAKPGKIAFCLMIVDAFLAVILLVLGCYMFITGAMNGNFIFILLSVVFLGIGGIRVKMIYPVLLATLVKDKEDEDVHHGSVIVPISRPETMESLVSIACDLLAKGGTLRLLNIIEVPLQLPYEYADTRKAKARELLMEASYFCEKRGVTPKLEIISARDIPEAILDLSSRYQADLVIMGSSQRSIPEKVLFGNVVDKVLRDAPAEVVIFSYVTFQPIKYEKILVPTSGYKHAQRALDIAIHFQKKFGGSITSMFVGQDSDADKANVILKNAKLHAEGLGSAIKTLFKIGSVVDNIVNTAKEEGSTLIIIGSTERPAYYKFLLGSTADEIITKVPCNVLVVRTKK